MDFLNEPINAAIFSRFFQGKTACCFTGHRPRALPKEGSPEGHALQEKLTMAVAAAAEAGVTTFLAGGAMGFDTLAAEAVIKERLRHPELRLVLALPAEDQAALWREQDRQRYERILLEATETHYAALKSTPQAMRKRNRYLAEHADCCLCWLASSAGGTFYTVNKALERGIPVYNLCTGDILLPEAKEEEA